MSRKRYVVCIAIVALAFLPAIACAISLGNGRLVSVTSTTGGCVSGPAGATVQSWDVEPGNTYTLTLSNVTECGNGGTDATINVRVNSSTPGYYHVDLVAYYVADGVYEFDYALPANAVCTMPIFYCTTPGDTTTGYFARRDDGGNKQAHLRASVFSPGCTYPAMITGPECGGTVPVGESTWGKIKALYN
jgi:hypothetical protein